MSTPRMPARKPTTAGSELVAKYRDLADDFRLRLANIRKIHRPADQNGMYCRACIERYPCATIRAAEGINEKVD